MADIMSAAARSDRMRRVRQRDTAPELALRHGLHRAGLRYRLHPADLPGRPDLVFPRYGVVVFVHGCFWHGHHCRAGKASSSNVTYWASKIADNLRRDRRKARGLRALGWKVITVWECQTKSARTLDATVRRLVQRIKESP